MSKRIKLEYDIPSEYYRYFYPHFFGYNQGNMRRDDAGSGFASWGIRWIYALLLLIVIVLQFGRKQNLENRSKPKYSECRGCEFYHPEDTGTYDQDSSQLIDNSILFIIVVFLLLLCGGCWWGDNYR
jgi:hypothetical protein